MQVRACARLWRLTLLLRRTFLEIHKIKSRSVKCVYLPTRGIEQSIPPRPESKDDLQGKIRCHRRGAFFSSPNYYYSAIKKTAVNKNPRWLKIGDKIPVMCFVCYAVPTFVMWHPTTKAAWGRPREQEVCAHERRNT